MSDATLTAAAPSRFRDPAYQRRLGRRHMRGGVFKYLGLGAVIIALTMLALLLASVVWRGYPAFLSTEIQLDVFFDPEQFPPAGERSREALAGADYDAILEDALQRRLGRPEDRAGRQDLGAMVADGAAGLLQNRVQASPELIGQTVSLWLPASAAVDQAVKQDVTTGMAAAERNVSDRQLAWMAELEEAQQLDVTFGTEFFLNSNSREPPLAGIWGAVVATFLTLIVTVTVAFPIAIMAAVYLEEFAPKTWWTDIIEININNLAAVPSIIFGVLGLAVFINFLGMPRSAPVTGGVTLGLLALPVIIISARSALKSVPPDFRTAAQMCGASRQQTVLFGVLPIALPGILTGTIIAMAEAMGETAPLLLIGMVAFVAAPPGGFTDAAAPLPVQIYLWAGNPTEGFVERSAAAILILLAFLVLMNLTAIILRKRFEKRW